MPLDLQITCCICSASAKPPLSRRLPGLHKEGTSGTCAYMHLAKDGNTVRMSPFMRSDKYTFGLCSCHHLCCVYASCPLICFCSSFFSLSSCVDPLISTYSSPSGPLIRYISARVLFYCALFGISTLRMLLSLISEERKCLAEMAGGYSSPGGHGIPANGI